MRSRGNRLVISRATASPTIPPPTMRTSQRDSAILTILPQPLAYEGLLVDDQRGRRGLMRECPRCASYDDVISARLRALQAGRGGAINSDASTRRNQRQQEKRHAQGWKGLSIVGSSGSCQ